MAPDPLLRRVNPAPYYRIRKPHQQRQAPKIREGLVRDYPLSVVARLSLAASYYGNRLGLATVKRGSGRKSLWAHTFRMLLCKHHKTCAPKQTRMITRPPFLDNYNHFPNSLRYNLHMTLWKSNIIKLKDRKN